MLNRFDCQKIDGVTNLPMMGALLFADHSVRGGPTVFCATNPLVRVRGGERNCKNARSDRLNLPLRNTTDACVRLALLVPREPKQRDIRCKHELTFDTLEVAM